MNRRRNPIFTFSLCTSLIVHGLALSALAWWVIEKTPLPNLPPIDRVQVLVEQMLQKTPPPPKPVEKKTPPPEPTKEFEKPQEIPKDDSGEANGKGTANRSTAGDKPMQAPQGYEQADLMKQADKFADDAFLPASAGAEKGNNTTAQKSPRAGTFSTDLTTNTKPAIDVKTLASAAISLSKDPGGLVSADLPQANAATASGTKNPIQNVAASQLPTPKAVQKEIRGHRATASDTESIAFAKSNSGVFRAGHLEGRNGLKVRSTIPRFGLSSELDMQALGGVRTVIGATVDVDGNVLNVKILRSSGSDNIDQDCKNAVWNWTLEPQKDKDGHPTSMQWTIAFE